MNEHKSHDTHIDIHMLDKYRTVPNACLFEANFDPYNIFEIDVHKA